MSIESTKIVKSKKNNSVWSRNFSLLLFSNFFLFLGAEMLSPVLPVYISQNGGNNAQIGIVMGSFTLSAIVIRLFAIKATDYLGQRLFLLIGLLVCVLVAGGYYLVTLILFIFLLRIFHGFGFGAATTLYGAMVSNIIPDSRMGEGMGIFGLGITIALAIGPFIGATTASYPNYKWIFFLSSGLILFAIFLTQISTAGRDPVHKRDKLARRISLHDFLEPKALMPSILGLIFSIPMSGVFTFIVLFARETGIKTIGIFFLISSSTEFIIRPVSGRLYDRRGHFLVLVPGALACAVGLIFLSMTSNLSMLIAASIFYGLGLGMIFPVLEAWALRYTKPHRRVAANATLYNFLDTGIGIGSVILGMLAQTIGYASMYFYSSLFFILFLLVYFIYYIKSSG